MNLLTIEKQRNIIIGILKPALVAEGYEYFVRDGGNDTFIKQTEFGSSSFYIYFKKYGDADYSGALLSFKFVEQIVMEVGDPNIDYSQRLKTNDFSQWTVLDQNSGLRYDTINSPIRESAQAIAFANAYLQYIQTAGLAFIEKYSYLPNVLTEMDRLEKEGKLWHEILNGLADHLFRGLIISKLCNDTAFLSKLEFCDHKFYNAPHLVEWIPYYEKLKERLKELEPKYITNG